MELKDQVCSFELAKKLKELGFEQESLFDWVEIDDNEWLLMGRKKEVFDKQNDEEKEGVVSAYTVAELYSLLYSLLYSNGICDMVISEEPNNLANYLAERLCQLKK